MRILRLLAILILPVVIGANAQGQEIGRIPINQLDELTLSELTNELHRLNDEVRMISKSYYSDNFGPIDPPSPPTPEQIKDDTIHDILQLHITKWRLCRTLSPVMPESWNLMQLKIPFGSDESAGASLIRDTEGLRFKQDGSNLVVQFPIRRWSQGNFTSETSYATMDNDCFLLFRSVYETEPKGIKVNDIVSWRIPNRERGQMTFFLKQYPERVGPPKPINAGTNSAHNFLHGIAPNRGKP